MSRFQPQPGMYFYTAVKSYTRDVEDFMGNVTQVVRRDGSYRGDVFYCMATDDQVLVCDRVYGGACYEPMVFVREDYEFTPIGPTVLSTLRPHFKHKWSTPVEENQE